MEGEDTELVIINTDWKIETVGVKSFGMCFVRVSPPYNYMDFKRGFPLPNPTHQRCAIFSLILGLEMLDAIPVETPRPRFVVSTKNKWLHSILGTGGALSKWRAANRWPSGISPMKGLLIRMGDMLSEMPSRSTVVLIERDSEDPPEINLETKDEDVDAEKIMKSGGGPDDIQKALRDMRMKNSMVQELLASGARGSRPKKKMPVQKKKDLTTKKTKKEDVVDGGKNGGGGAEARAGDDGGAGPDVRTNQDDGGRAQVPQCNPVGREQLAQDSN